MDIWKNKVLHYHGSLIKKLKMKKDDKKKNKKEMQRKKCPPTA